MRFACPNCNVILTIANHAGDFVHECNSGIEAVDQEDILKIGTQTDYTGTFTEPKNFISVAGLANTLSERAKLDAGTREFPRSVRGKKKDLYRQRQKLFYIEHPEEIIANG